MQQKIKDLYLTHEALVRYGIMAVIVVGIEYGSYVAMVWAGVNYLLAVPLSMAVGIVLNWIGSRMFVFKNRRHAAHKEFMLVLATSLVGVGIQLLVTYIVVQITNLPAIGKLCAIVITFFWNYLIRKKYIY